MWFFSKIRMLLEMLLSQPSFIKSHLHRSIKTKDEIYMVVFDQSTFTFTAHPSKSPHVKLPNFIQLPVVDPSDRYLYHELLGSINGLLLCFSYHVRNADCSLQIWNPSLSALLEIPDAGEFSDRFWFGFDPNTHDYKVVRLSYVGEEPEVFKLVHVFSMRNRSWEPTKEMFPSHAVVFGYDKVCGDGHDGRLHWLCYADEEMKLQTRVAFDMGVESFSEMSLPLPVLHNLDRRKNSIGILAGKVCLISCVKEEDGCEVWVMNEYGDVTSWAKHHLFTQFSCDIAPLGFTLNNEFLFIFNNVPVMYDPITSKVTSFMTMADHYFRIFQYVDSLVWINPSKR